MLRTLRLHCFRSALLLLPLSALVLSACSDEDTSSDSDEDEEKAAPKRKKREKPKDEGSPTPAAVEASPTPEPITMRDGSPVIFAEYQTGLVVPVATQRGGSWSIEEVHGLESLPVNSSANKTIPEPLVKWWDSLDIKDGDVFILRGDMGAEGVLTVRREFAYLDRGGCMGQVWAIPGKADWKVKPKRPKDGEIEDAVHENVWAIRGTFAPKVVRPGRELSPEETKAGEELLKKLREDRKKTLPKIPKDASWQECDSMNKPKCAIRRAVLTPIELDGDAAPETIATFQFKPSSNAPQQPDAIPKPVGPTVESRLLLDYGEKSASVIAQWDGDPKKKGDDQLPQVFSGAIDLTGDGRAEVILNRTANEVTNWEIYSSTVAAPNSWTLLFKTNYDGC